MRLCLDNDSVPPGGQGQPVDIGDGSLLSESSLHYPSKTVACHLPTHLQTIDIILSLSFHYPSIILALSFQDCRLPLHPSANLYIILSLSVHYPPIISLLSFHYPCIILPFSFQDCRPPVHPSADLYMLKWKCHYERTRFGNNTNFSGQKSNVHVAASHQQQWQDE